MDTAKAQTGASPMRSTARLTPEGSVVVEGLTKRYGTAVAVDAVSFAISPGEAFCLLGPSGSGKTTTLRMIAGLEEPDSGMIRVGDTTLVDTEKGTLSPPESRSMGMVFQSYAIWPHMTVYDNVAFPLKVRRASRKEIRTRVMEVLSDVGLEEESRRPASRLSGGQQQRVALARALVYRPSVLLLDEPLSNLDANLRGQMRRQIERLRREYEVTMIFVTHDQAEAMTLSDRMAVMKLGHIAQIGTPKQLYQHPSSAFVRDFLGQTIKLQATVVLRGTEKWVKFPGAYSSVEFRVPPSETMALSEHQAVTVVTRPERTSLHSPGSNSGPCSPYELTATVVDSEYLGERTEYTLSAGGNTLRIADFGDAGYRDGDSVHIRLDPSNISIWSD